MEKLAMHGTWQTTGGGGGGFPKELIGLALVLAAMIGVAGAVKAALAAVLIPLIIGVMVFMLAAAAGAAAFALHRHRTGRPLFPRAAVPMYRVHQLGPEPEPRVVPAAQPGTVIIGGQHIHVERGTDLSGLPLAFPSGIAVTATAEEEK
jgi:hypothetical protein